ncbi:MAG: MoaE-MoaD fusion protein [Candidatus Sumerlaeota bacterium]|nr:MoaE-MoaD fusion protein [Candidatus Sumerlaeota bacterium]
MKIDVLYFQVLKLKAGTARETLDVAAGTTVAGALDAVESLHPELLPLRASLLAAVNQEWAPPETVLREGDVLALMPPVSGG